MYCYVPIKETLFAKELGTYTTYGIRCYDGNCEVAYISDVSVDYAVVSSIAKRCTEGQLLPMHLLDVVMDSI